MKGTGIKDAVRGLLTPEVPKSEPVPVKKAPPPPQEKKRTLGDIFVALEAQKVYQPNLPSVPQPQAPPANMQDQGTAPNLGTTGSWNTPEEK